MFPNTAVPAGRLSEVERLEADGVGDVLEVSYLVAVDLTPDEARGGYVSVTRRRTRAAFKVLYPTARVELEMLRTISPDHGRTLTGAHFRVKVVR